MRKAIPTSKPRKERTPSDANRPVSPIDTAIDSGNSDEEVEAEPQPRKIRRNTTSKHDLDNRYFQKDVVIFHNFDFCRAQDLGFALVLIYCSVLFLLPLATPRSRLLLACANAIFWRCFHSFGLGLALKYQSESRWLVRHFRKHYYYEDESAVGPVDQAFANWTAVYNFSLMMVYLSFALLAWLCARVPSGWTVGSEALRYTAGLLLVALHVWTARATYEVLGSFGCVFSVLIARRGIDSRVDGSMEISL